MLPGYWKAFLKITIIRIQNQNSGFTVNLLLCVGFHFLIRGFSFYSFLRKLDITATSTHKRHEIAFFKNHIRRHLDILINSLYQRYHEHYYNPNVSPPTPVPGAFGGTWTYPRPKKHATGMFLTLAALRPAFQVLVPSKKVQHRMVLDFFGKWL